MNLKAKPVGENAAHLFVYFNVLFEEYPELRKSSFNFFKVISKL